MSVEEDIELKNLVAQTLENKGVLPKIRAELRANVFLALEQNPSTKEILLKNEELSAFLKVPFGALILNLIREFLEFFELEFTLSVFEPETKYEKEYHKIERDKMIDELKIVETNAKFPLLYEIIQRVINDSKIAISDKSFEISHSDNSSRSEESGNILPMPVPLNSTFVKKSDIESTPLSPILKDNDINESIKEELNSNSTSDLDSLPEAKEGINKSSVLETSKIFSNENLKEPVFEPIVAKSKDTIEIDLLTFTPVKESKSKEKAKIPSVPRVNELKTDDKIEVQKSMSALSDLPPLTFQSDERGFNINEIKAIIDEWSGKNTSNDKDEMSLCSKSSKNELYDDKSPNNLKSEAQDFSQKSENTEIDDFEEDISDLLNGHTPLENRNTVDETISQVSCAADYLENL